MVASLYWQLCVLEAPLLFVSSHCAGLAPPAKESAILEGKEVSLGRCMCRQLRVHKFAAKPAGIPRFWALEPCSQSDSQQLTSLLGYLNRPASSLGGCKRMGVVRVDDTAKVDLGLVAGSDGSGGIGGVMFCLKDAQM